MLWVVRGVMLGCTAIVAAFVGAAVFAIGYWRYIPPAQHALELFFKYPEATATLHFPPILRAGQLYDVLLRATVPDKVSPGPDSTTNFMIELRLGHGPKTLLTTSKPGMLRYRSALVAVAHKLVLLPMLLLGLRDEQRREAWLLVENYRELVDTPLTNVSVRLQRPVAFTKAELLLPAHYSTAQRLVSRYWIACFLLWEVAIAIGACLCLLLVLLAKQWRKPSPSSVDALETEWSVPTEDTDTEYSCARRRVKSLERSDHEDEDSASESEEHTVPLL